jgi:hypothetical protein
MGLDCSHNAFSGAYSSFNRLRQYVAKVAGGSFPPHNDPALDWNQWYFESAIVPNNTVRGMHLFLEHSDCDGEFSPEECSLVAEFLDWIVSQDVSSTAALGHLARNGPDMKDSVRRFSDGCKAAAAAGESLEFA